MNTCYDGANRVSQVGGALCGNATGAYAANFLYASHGAPTQYAMGNNVWHEPSYNPRLQMSGFADVLNNTTSLLTGMRTWQSSQTNTNDNGNLWMASYTHAGPGFTTPLTLTDTFNYDGVNRLTMARALQRARVLEMVS